MPEQIVCNIVRPEVGVGYIAESREATDADRLAACYVSINAVAKEIRRLSKELGKAYPELIEDVISADLW